MAGHSKWSNIKHKKARQDKKKGKLFSKFSRKIISAARRGGGDPEKNLELANVIERAREHDMPKDNIERSIKKGTGDLPGVQYEDATYEGYGPGGVAVIVDVTTDNKNRSIAEIRKIFEDHKGNVGARGCVSYLFDRKGYITVDSALSNELQLFELVVEAGAEDLQESEEEGCYEIYTPVERFSNVKKILVENDIKPKIATITRIPRTTVPVETSESKLLLKLLDALDDHNDVQDVDSNFSMDDEE